MDVRAVTRALRGNRALVFVLGLGVLLTLVRLGAGGDVGFGRVNYLGMPWTQLAGILLVGLTLCVALLLVARVVDLWTVPPEGGRER